jgi:hypothetical protein
MPKGPLGKMTSRVARQAANNKATTGAAKALQGGGRRNNGPLEYQIR